MSDRLRVNHTSHCDLCTPGVRNYVRVHVGDPNDCGPRVAVCPVHDLDGPVEALSGEMRRVLAAHVAAGIAAARAARNA